MAETDYSKNTNINGEQCNQLDSFIMSLVLLSDSTGN